MATKRCKCGLNFTFSHKDKVYYEERGFPEPKKCQKCRTIKKNIEPVNRSWFDPKVTNDSYEQDIINRFVGARFTDIVSNNAPVKGVVKFNTKSSQLYGAASIKMLMEEFAYRINTEAYEINNTKYKNYN